MRHVPLLEIPLVVRHVDDFAGGRGDLSFVHRVFIGMDQRHHAVRPLVGWKVETRYPARDVDGRLQSPLEVGNQRGQFVGPRRSMKAPHRDVDRMNRPATKHFQQAIPMFFQPQAAIDLVGKVAGKRQTALVPQEIGRVQQVHVQNVALDPFPAIQQATQPANLGRRGDAERRFQSMDRAHLVGDRADAANSGGDVGYFFQGPTAQQRLEQPRRFENRQLHVFDPIAAKANVQSPFALDTSQGLDANRARAAGILGISHDRSARGSGKLPGDRRQCGNRERNH